MFQGAGRRAERKCLSGCIILYSRPPEPQTRSPADVIVPRNLIFHRVSAFFTGRGVKCIDFHRREENND
ncbi:hypothetical protein PBY51_002422 [Eleginops maclovinus]|uniref:Uncharacterized protein n=1 Tax=Eleginops maclovinus TaxID=56733 RepID=A0AAN8AJC3_ELEMC|nr:hypothetical protein PBY51_002422 [Eleginops maclovinus]